MDISILEDSFILMGLDLLIIKIMGYGFPEPFVWRIDICSTLDLF